jgi:hypothetical protein
MSLKYEFTDSPLHAPCEFQASVHSPVVSPSPAANMHRNAASTDESVMLEVTSYMDPSQGSLLPLLVAGARLSTVNTPLQARENARDACDARNQLPSSSYHVFLAITRQPRGLTWSRPRNRRQRMNWGSNPCKTACIQRNQSEM